MKKLILLTLTLIVLVGCETSLTTTSGKITSVEKCGEYATSIIHLDGERAFKLKDTRCKVLKEGANVELTYDSSLRITDIKYIETKGDN